MENRRVIYYGGNSIKPRKISMPSIQKRLRQKGMGIADPQMRHMPPIIEKTYATKNCVWCPHDFDKFQIVCNQCHNCQYCGMVSSDSRLCGLCGNRLPDELKESSDNHKQIIRFV